MLTPLLNVLLAFTPCICIYFYLKYKAQLEKEYAEKLVELGSRVHIEPETSQEILSDLKQRGFSVIRIDTNDIFYRSPKG